MSSVTPLVDLVQAANAQGAAFSGTLVGGMNTNGTVQTQGSSGQTITNVDATACSSASGVDSTASGLCSQATANGATAYGSNAQATDTNTTALGFRATASYEGSVAIGYNAQAVADPTVAVGSNSLASGNNSVAVGASAQATGNNSVALGAGSVATEDDSVSVGSVGNERRIVNVAGGVNATDAVNVGQLNNAISGVNNQMNEVARNAYSGVAAATALAMIPEVDPGKTLAIGVGTATYNGYQAMAIGGTARITQNIKMKAGVGISGGTTVGVGASYQW
jgi:trimeric autotransporter adhesin